LIKKNFSSAIDITLFFAIFKYLPLILFKIDSFKGHEFFLFVQNHDMVRKSAKMKFNFYIWYTIKDNNIFEYDEKGIQIGDIFINNLFFAIKINL
jgi:hypothetical protein